MSMLHSLPISVEMPLGVESNDNFDSFAGAYRFEAGYGLTAPSGGTPTISHHISISVADTEPQCLLHAVLRGRVRFVPAGEGPARIELQPLPFEQVIVGERLSGSVLPNLFVYGNIDPATVEAAADARLRSGPADTARTAQLAEFMAGTRWLTVEAGAMLGKPAVDATLGGRRRLDLSTHDQRGFFLNPAHYLFQWPSLRDALAEHPLILELATHQHAHIFPTKSRILLVRHDAPNPAPPYTTADTAARMINDAMVVAAPGDIVCVIDNAVYAEKVFMVSGVTLTSVAAVGTMSRPAEADAALPTLSDPGSLSAAVVFEDLGAEPTHISGFKITAGRATDGAGVVIRNSINVEVAQSDIFSNQGVHGGGIAIVDSRRVVVARCRIRDNQGNDPPGGGKGQGGGIYVGGKSSDILVEENYIYRNQATNFGGGVCVDFPARRVLLRRNRIGGASAAEGNRVTLDRLPYDQSVILDNPQGGGGGIGVFDTEVVLVENEIWHNEAHAGGGIEFYVRAYGRLVRNDIANNRTRPEAAHADLPLGGDGGGIAVNNTSLTAETAGLHRTVVLVDNRIRNNLAEADGGGIYGTAKALIEISGNNTEISGNEARQNGGGVRVSFGSQIRIRGGVIRNNRANTGICPNPQNALDTNCRGGGGGIAVRNSKLVLEDCLIEQNHVDNFGGGGVYIVTLAEGPFDPVLAAIVAAIVLPTLAPIIVPSANAFDDVLTQSYGFSRAELRINRARITNNTASGALGAGAGLYGVYDEYDLYVRVDDTVLNGNHPNHSDPDKRKNVVFQDTFRLLIGGIDNDDDLPSLNPLHDYENTFSP